MGWPGSIVRANKVGRSPHTGPTVHDNMAVALVALLRPPRTLGSVGFHV